MEKSQFFSYAGFHFKLCSLELRELFAYIFNPKIILETSKRYLSDDIEFVPLYTCNRFDICVFGEVIYSQILNLFYDLAIQATKIKYKTLPMCHLQLKEHISKALRFSIDQEALRLFLNVATSLDSLVLGGSQIFGQIKKAYIDAKINGFAGKKAAKIFNHSFKTTKRIRTETDLFKYAVSIGTLAVECAKKEFIDIKSKKIVIFGAGEMALLTARHFLYHGAKNLFIANRTIQRAQLICEKLNYGKSIHLLEALNNLTDFDICVVAIGGEDILIKNSNLLNYNHKIRDKKTLFIDISTPRKIDIDIDSFKNMTLFNIDQLSAIVEKNKEARRNAIEKVEEIINEENKHFLDKMFDRKNNHKIHEFNQWINRIVQNEIDKFLQQKNKKNNIHSSIVARAVCKKINSKLRKRSDILI